MQGYSVTAPYPASTALPPAVPPFAPPVVPPPVMPQAKVTHFSLSSLAPSQADEPAAISVARRNSPARRRAGGGAAAVAAVVPRRRELAAPQDRPTLLPTRHGTPRVAVANTPPAPLDVALQHNALSFPASSLGVSGARRPDGSLKPPSSPQSGAAGGDECYQERRPTDPFFYPTTVSPLTCYGLDAIQQTTPPMVSTTFDNRFAPGAQVGGGAQKDGAPLLADAPLESFVDQPEEMNLFQRQNDSLARQVQALEHAKSLAAVQSMQALKKIQSQKEQLRREAQQALQHAKEMQQDFVVAPLEPLGFLSPSPPAYSCEELCSALPLASLDELRTDVTLPPPQPPTLSEAVRDAPPPPGSRAAAASMRSTATAAAAGEPAGGGLGESPLWSKEVWPTLPQLQPQAHHAHHVHQQQHDHHGGEGGPLEMPEHGLPSRRQPQLVAHRGAGVAGVAPAQPHPGGGGGGGDDARAAADYGATAVTAAAAAGILPLQESMASSQLPAGVVPASDISANANHILSVHNTPFASPEGGALPSSAGAMGGGGGGHSAGISAAVTTSLVPSGGSWEGKQLPQGGSLSVPYVDALGNPLGHTTGRDLPNIKDSLSTILPDLHGGGYYDRLYGSLETAAQEAAAAVGWPPGMMAAGLVPGDAAAGMSQLGPAGQPPIVADPLGVASATSVSASSSSAPPSLLPAPVGPQAAEPQALLHPGGGGGGGAPQHWHRGGGGGGLHGGGGGGGEAPTSARGSAGNAAGSSIVAHERARGGSAHGGGNHAAHVADARAAAATAERERLHRGHGGGHGGSHSSNGGHGCGSVVGGDRGAVDGHGGGAPFPNIGGHSGSDGGAADAAAGAATPRTRPAAESSTPVAAVAVQVDYPPPFGQQLAGGGEARGGSRGRSASVERRDGDGGEGRGGRAERSPSRQRSTDEGKLTGLQDASEQLQAELEECLDMIRWCAGSVTRESLQELKATSKPPPVVKDVLETVALLLGTPETRWDKLKRLIAAPTFLERIQRLSFQQSITRSVFRELRDRLQHPGFDEEQIKSVCVPVVPLAMWCRAIGVYLSKTKFRNGPEIRPVAAAGAPASALVLMAERPVAPTEASYMTFEPDLASLTPEELRCVRELTISRPSVGQITFHGETDCSDLDLERIVRMEIGEVLVYPDSSLKPPIGVGLNKAATLTMFQCWPPNGSKLLQDPKSQERYRRKIRQMTEEKHARFLDYDCNTGVWKFSVNHF